MSFPFSQTITMQDSAVALGNGLAVSCGDSGTLVMQVTGITSATITFEATVDGTNYVAVPVMNMNLGSIATTTTANGLFGLSVAGLVAIRARISTYATGTIVVTGRLNALAFIPFADVQLSAGSAAIGKLAANSGVDIGDVDVTSVPDELEGPGGLTVDSYTCAVVNLAASTDDQTLAAAPGSNKQIWVYGLFMMADTAAGTVTVQDEDNTAHSGTMAVSDEGGWVLPISGNFAMPWMKVATNKALEADTGACTVDGIICYGIADVS